MKVDLNRIVLPVSDPEASADFYREAFGFEEAREPGWDRVRWFEGGNGILLGLSPASTGAGHGVQPTHLVLRVDDVGEVRRRLEEAGARVDEAPSLRDAIVAPDPDGHRLVIVAGRGIAPRMESNSRVVGHRLLLEEEIRTHGRPEEVWHALTDPALLSAWMCGGPAHIEPRAGGKLMLTFPHIGRDHTTWHCRILEFIAPARLKFKEERLNLEVTFDLAPQDASDARVRLTQSPLDLGEFEDPPAVIAQKLALSWRRILRRLQLLVEDELGTAPSEEDEE